MKTSGTIADFRQWLRAEIAELDETSPEENRFWEAAGTIQEARRMALALDRPDVAKLCRVGNRPLALTVAQEVLSACLASLRAKQPAALQAETLSPPEVARRYGVSPDTVRAWIAAGQLHATNVGKGKCRPRYRVPVEALKELDAKRPARIVPKVPPQRRRRRTLDLPFTRYTSRPKASPERGR